MKHFALSLLLIASLTACEDDDDTDPDVLSSWRLEAVLEDPGDGSATFQSVDSERRIDLLRDGTYVATGNLCEFSTTAEFSTVGTYDLAAGTLSPSGCNPLGDPAWGLSIEGERLVLNYWCREGCLHRYARKR